MALWNFFSCLRLSQKYFPLTRIFENMPRSTTTPSSIGVTTASNTIASYRKVLALLEKGQFHITEVSRKIFAMKLTLGRFAKCSSG